MNPLVDFKNMPAEELQNKISDLTRRLIASHNANSSSVPQLSNLLETYKEEMIRRTTEKDMIDDPDNQPGVILDTDDEGKEKDNFDKLIDIG